jgi:hypothetical protein
LISGRLNHSFDLLKGSGFSLVEGLLLPRFQSNGLAPASGQGSGQETIRFGFGHIEPPETIGRILTGQAPTPNLALN